MFAWIPPKVPYYNFSCNFTVTNKKYGVLRIINKPRIYIYQLSHKCPLNHENFKTQFIFLIKCYIKRYNIVEYS